MSNLLKRINVLLVMVLLLCATVPVSASTAGSSKTASMVAAGDGYALALNSEGRVFAWGENDLGQLGDGTLKDHTTYVSTKLPSGTTSIFIAAGGGQSFAIDSNGSLWGWGCNYYGEVGDGTTANKKEPVHIGFPGDVSIASVAADTDRSMALDSTGVVWLWGRECYWKGADSSGKMMDSQSPRKVDFPEGVSISSIAIGFHQYLALDTEGHVWQWSPLVSPYTPAQVRFPENTVIKAIDAGVDHCLAIDSADKTWAWGADLLGQLGNGQVWDDSDYSVPILVSLKSTIHAFMVQAADKQSFVLDGDGNIWAFGNYWLWGDSTYGDDGDILAAQGTPTMMTKLKDIIYISMFTDNSYAICNDGTVWAWGSNNWRGGLGDGTTKERTVPEKVKGLKLSQ